MKHFKFLFFGLFILKVVVANGQNGVNLSADSLYNLGNAAYSIKQYDSAIYYYEKAKLLDPNATDILTNLQLANEQLSTDIIEIEPFFLASWWESIGSMMLPGGWKIVSVLILLCLLVLVYFHLFKNKLENKSLFYSTLSLLALLFLISVIAGKTRTDQLYHSPFVIVFGEDQSLYQGPDLVSEKVKQITGGNKLRILDEFEDWYRVSAMDSEQGWIKKENVKHITF